MNQSTSSAIKGDLKKEIETEQELYKNRQKKFLEKLGKASKKKSVLSDSPDL